MKPQKQQACAYIRAIIHPPPTHGFRSTAHELVGLCTPKYLCQYLPTVKERERDASRETKQKQLLLYHVRGTPFQLPAVSDLTDQHPFTRCLVLTGLDTRSPLVPHRSNLSSSHLHLSLSSSAKSCGVGACQRKSISCTNYRLQLHTRMEMDAYGKAQTCISSLVATFSAVPRVVICLSTLRHTHVLVPPTTTSDRTSMPSPFCFRQSIHIVLVFSSFASRNLLTHSSVRWFATPRSHFISRPSKKLAWRSIVGLAGLVGDLPRLVSLAYMYRSSL